MPFVGGDGIVHGAPKMRPVWDRNETGMKPDCNQTNTKWSKCYAIPSTEWPPWSGPTRKRSVANGIGGCRQECVPPSSRTGSRHGNPVAVMAEGRYPRQSSAMIFGPVRHKLSFFSKAQNQPRTSSRTCTRRAETKQTVHVFAKPPRASNRLRKHERCLSTELSTGTTMHVFAKPLRAVCRLTALVLPNNACRSELGLVSPAFRFFP